ncbi:MAG: alanine--tRNA ligase [Ignavibacteria bacterium]|nr:alanine--tRNA ligase [Ignavibacteria bacterium]
MKSKEVRKSFLDFFESKGHRIVPSSPVVPYGDPTLLFTNAGMNQFKDVFLGTGTRDYRRAANTQKCIRVSGKHNDLEDVGYDTYHHTFFEMLGNWSFGDYYKEEAIEFAWELLTEVWNLPEDRLFATVFRTDDEAFEVWRRFLPTNRIFRFDEKDNFWEMGEVGPCGPCSEIHFDRTKEKNGAHLINTGSPDVIEIWNLVFIQYNRNEDGLLTELPAKHVDTGMGLERITAILQGKDSNYDTDLFQPLIQAIEEFSNRKYPQSVSHPDGIAMRVLADHIRTLSFAIADGAFPSNEGRGYVLRRILRRASRFARQLGMKEPTIYKLVPVLIDIMGDFFKEIVDARPIIEKYIKAEEESFSQTLDRGLEVFEQIVEELRKDNSKTIPGDRAFQLYDTFGFPIDLTQLLARENNLKVDIEGFNEKMEEQRNRSRQSGKSFQSSAITGNQDFKTHFTGYEEFETEAKVVFIEGNQVVTDASPFYVESGGQISDTGEIVSSTGVFNVVDVIKVGNSIVHILDTEPGIFVGEKVVLKLNKRRRLDIMRNHSATHLLHESLCRVLGDHIRQSGSLVAPDYFRFDFNHFEKLNSEQIAEIESLVNEKIFESLPVIISYMSLEDAKTKTRAKMFFGEKYENIVRVVTMGDFSQELCGGTHVRNTNEIGIFKILSEQSIASGVRRIEATTGRNVYQFINNLTSQIAKLEEKNLELEDNIKKLQKKLQNIEKEQILNNLKNWVLDAKHEGNIRYIAKEIEAESVDELRDYADEIRNIFKKSGIGFLFLPKDDKIYIACSVTDDLKEQFPAGNLVNFVAQKLGGKGGGRQHLATAGTKFNPEYKNLLATFSSIIKELLNKNN